MFLSPSQLCKSFLLPDCSVLKASVTQTPIGYRYHINQTVSEPKTENISQVVMVGFLIFPKQVQYLPSRFPCCVLSYFSLVFVMEHSRRWQLHIGGSKMFEPLFRAGLSFSGHFFCKIFVFDISNLNFRGHFLVGSAD